MTLEIRDFELRKVDTKNRSVVGLAVPYNQTANVGPYQERFEAGAISGVEGVKLCWEHGEVIGKVVEGRDVEDGYEIRAEISKTTKGNDALVLLDDKVVDRFSVGFLPLEQRFEDDGDTVVRTKVDLKEVSLVPFPAYAGATVSEVRSTISGATSETSNNKEVSAKEADIKKEMTEVNYADASDVADLRDAVAEVERRIAGLNDSAEEVAPKYRSAGAYLKGLVAGEDTATQIEAIEKRAYTGAQLSDTTVKDAWGSDSLLKIVNRGRPVLNAFSRESLASTGMAVTYPKIKTLTGTVGVQAAEGDDLNYVEIQTETASAPVKTYGAYSQLSRQVIERTEIPFLQKTLEFQASAYAKATNDAVRAAIVAATPQTGASLTLTSATGAAWIGGVYDGLNLIYDNGLGAEGEFLFVSRDVFKQLLTLSDTANRPLFAVNGDGANTIGNANVRNAGSLAGVPVVVDAGLAAKTLYVASSDAVTTWEAPGVPFRLDDENPINLTKVYSIYGYMAVGVPNPKGLVKFTIA